MWSRALAAAGLRAEMLRRGGMPDCIDLCPGPNFDVSARVQAAKLKVQLQLC